MADPNRDMAAVLQGGLLPAAPPTTDMIQAALGPLLTNKHLSYPGDDPMGELVAQKKIGLDPLQLALGLVGGPRGALAPRVPMPPAISRAPAEVAGDAAARWSAKGTDFATRAAEARERLADVRDRTDNLDLTRVLNHPAVPELSARRTAVYEGQPAWSKVGPYEQDQYRQDVANYGAPRNFGFTDVPQTELNIPRDRYLSTQQGQWTKNENKRTQNFIAEYNRRMEELLKK